MKLLKTINITLLLVFIVLFNLETTLAEPTYNVVLTSEVEWEQLNPARSSNSPMAATLWGDRTGSGPSGFLLKLVDGFKSPPHIHTANYHGVVIKGTVHNAEPDAKEVYLPAGSFWTQPDGGVHITAAKGSSLAYIEFEGALDVLPAEEATNKETEATVVQASSINWVDQPGMPASANGPKIAVLWGSPQHDQLSGTLVKLPAGFTGMMSSSGSTFHAVVIQGQPKHRVPGEVDVKTMEPGSYFGSKGNSVHQISCEDGEDCMIYVRTEGKFDIIQPPLVK
ncbi:MAG: hypothetical protein DHS20C13_03610 [Thermodesulfobacteriota bacterium]|nr:MAG: hypothetical protein DHS20C13_03610 [Thermodesulfobacteriota bacterium]